MVSNKDFLEQQEAMLTKIKNLKAEEWRVVKCELESLAGKIELFAKDIEEQKPLFLGEAYEEILRDMHDIYTEMHTYALITVAQLEGMVGISRCHIQKLAEENKEEQANDKD